MGGGGGGEHVATMSNSNASCFRVGLSWVELRRVLTTMTMGLTEDLGYFKYKSPHIYIWEAILIQTW